MEDSYAMGRHYSEQRGRRKDRQTVEGHTSRHPRLSIVKPVPRSRLVAGIVVWAHVPYEDGTGEKTRPAVVLSASGHKVVVLPATTSPSRLRYPDLYVEVADLDGAGIVRP